MTNPGFGKIALLPIVLIFSILSINLSHAASYGSISGKVLDATNAPLTGATVTLVDFTGVNKGTGTTDASGNYSFGSLPTGLYYVQFSKTGLLTAWNGGATSQQTAAPIELLAPNAITGINGKLVQGASISGAVKDSNDAPMSGVFVSLYSSSGSSINYATTDATGNYQFDGLAGGTFYLRCSTSGMPPVWYGGASTRQTSTPITLSAPNVVTGINCQLGVGASISGVVTDLLNVPRPNASVTLYNATKTVIDWEWGSTNVDASGNYSFRGLASGAYYIQYTESGMQPSWYGGSTLETATPIAVVSPNATTGINGQLGPGGSIRGTVTDTYNNPLSSVSLTLYDSTGTNVIGGNSSTDSSGNYSFDGLESGTYYLKCSKVEFATVWYGGATTLETAKPINVTVPNATTGINVQMVMTFGLGSISGRVTDAADNPLYDISVSLYDSTKNDVSQTSTDANGYYSLNHLSSGTYYMKFYPHSYAMPSIWYGGSSTSQDAAPITVNAPEATTGINGRLGVGGGISGYLTNPSGIPLSGAGVGLYDSAGNLFLVTSTDSSGSYSFKGLADGMYYIRFSISGMPPVWYGKPLIITAQNSITGINGVLLAGGTIRGNVRDAYNTPISNARVTLCNSVGDSLVTLYTDSFGNYMIGAIAEGIYYLKFSANGMQSVWYSGTANRLAATPVTVASSSVLTGIDAQLGIGGTISGRILGATDTFFSPLTVSLFDTTGKLISYTRPYELGDYSFTGLASGIYYVQVTFFYRYGAIWYGGASWQTAIPIEVTAPGAVTGIDITYGGFTDNWIDSEVYGTGGGTITSAPAGISCMKDLTAGCSAPFAKSETVTLVATPESTSVFSGWGGDCSGTSNCTVDMASTHFIGATFTSAPKAKIGDTGYISLGFAYTAAATGDEIHALDTVLAEELILADNKSVAIKGGYRANYASRSSNNTVLSGSLTVQSGRLIVDSLTIR